MVTVSVALAKGSGALGTGMRGIGGFVTLSLDILVQAVRPPFAWREFIQQMAFISRACTISAMLLSIPFSLILALQVGIVLFNIGAIDLISAGIALSTITQTGPMTTVFVIAGSGATAVCADLGARTIREEIDAMRVMGVDPVRALLVPRVAALTICAMLLNAITCGVGLIAGYIFSVWLQDVNPGAFAANLTLITGLSDTTVSFVKATLFGLMAGLIACYKGTTPRGGPQGVGNAVNETVVFSFMALMYILVMMDFVGAQVKL
ncbi:MAG: ABC transporter permease [Mycobacterium sp.]|uniref:MlaE family ABC transporter permease n=1 Tax=Mycobacterium sp. TaxID=1785 RepID=UPI00262F4A35|nr:ABC transporter permease [Mycobacterium sp.]MDI3313930.1 ABC transporter permease [Mycobacterium sp.]